MNKIISTTHACELMTAVSNIFCQRKTKDLAFLGL